MTAKVELLINGTWEDVSGLVSYKRQPVSVRSGRPNEAQQLVPGRCELTFGNTSRDLVPENTSGPYYPWLTRNTQMRVSVPDSGGSPSYRWCGEVPGWPQRWDPTGHDVWVPVQAAGIWRRLSRSNSTAGSAQYRFWTRPVGVSVPDVYWPCEDGSGSTSLASALGGSPLTITGTPSLASDTSFAGSNALPQLRGSTWSATFTGASGGTANVLTFDLSVPSSGGTDGAILARLFTSGTVARINIVYHTGGNLQVLGYDSSSVLLFDSGSNAYSADGTPLVVRASLTQSGTLVDWELSAVQPGHTSASAVTHNGSITGTIGANTQVDVNAGGTETGDTAVGHIAAATVAQTLTLLAAAAGGYDGEFAADRFIRLCGEEGIGCTLSDAGRWGFEQDITGWVGVGGTLSRSPAWAESGTYSCLITAAGGADAEAHGPEVACSPGDRIALKGYVYSPSALAAAGVRIAWYDSGGSAISSAASTPAAQTAGTAAEYAVAATAPASTAGYRVQFFDDDASVGAGTLIYGDVIRSGAQMGPQLDQAIASLLQECEDTDRGLLYETRSQFGLGYRTRADLRGQSAAVTFDYTADELSPPLKPTEDDLLIRNDVTISRTGGSSARATLDTGSMSTQAPPNGVGRYAWSKTVNAFEDAQLQGIADWVLSLGTVDGPRYPQISVSLTGTALGSTLADEVLAAAAGDYVEVTNPPDMLPSGPVQQLAFGFAELITEHTHTIAWNCVPESPYA